MRFNYFLVVAVAALLSSCNTASAASGAAKRVMLQSDDGIYMDNNDNRQLRSRKTANMGTGTATTEEERIAGGVNRLWDWTYFSKKELVQDAERQALRIRDVQQMGWIQDEQIERRIGQAKLTDVRLAEVLVQYVQNYRKYKQFPALNLDI